MDLDCTNLFEDCLGSEFLCFSDFESKFEEFCQKTGTVYYKVNTMSVEAENRRRKIPIPLMMKYSRAIFRCVHFGERKSTSLGIRKHTRYLPMGCEAEFRLSYTDGALKVKAKQLTHNHPVVPESANGDQPSIKAAQRRFSRIYTKTGDKGTSGLFTGARKPKDDAIFKALGATDELSSIIGVAAEFCRDVPLNDLQVQLQQIQCILQDVGSNVATPLSSARDTHLKRVKFSKNHVQLLENWIDDMTAQLPPLKQFILPSGGKSATHLHLARAVCRRAERELTPLSRAGEIGTDTFAFMNRLSDYLFTAARFAALQEGREEQIYKRIALVEKENENVTDME